MNSGCAPDDNQSVVPSPAEGWAPPQGYRVKRCKYCRTYSWQRTPLPLGIDPAWDPITPWYDGTSTVDCNVNV